MNLFNKSVMAMIFFAVVAANAAPRVRSGKTNAIRSVFVLPSNPQQGRDPFFPDSNRPYEHALAAKPRVADVSLLVIKGFSGTITNRLVIINNRTFAAGDEGDVTTPIGLLHLRCLEIGTNSVVVEVGGQRHELFYSNKL